MVDYSWPGNVRQLESAIERAILLCEGDEIMVEDLPLEVRQEARPARKEHSNFLRRSILKMSAI